jgi:signal transduction histidine kinase
MIPFQAESNKPEIKGSKALYPKATHVIETLLSSSGNEPTETINYATNASVEADTKTTKHAFNLLEHEIKNPLAAIQTNQELLLNQLEFLDQEDRQNHILQAPDYKGTHKLCQTLGIAINITQYSLQSLTHIGETFKKVRQATGLFCETKPEASQKEPLENPSVEQAFNLLEYGLKDPLMAIQSNQELLLEQLNLLAQEALEGRLVTTADYQGKVPLSKLLTTTVEMSKYSLKSLHHIGEVFTNVRQLTGLFRKQDVDNPNTPIKPTYKMVRLKRLVLQALEQCHNQYPSIQTKIDCTLNEKISVMGKESLLKQAFLNIIQNGYEALVEFQPTSACLTIRLHEVIKPFKAVTIAIHNNGPMIPPEIMTQIFDPYVSTKTKQVFDGNQGLGLAVSKQAIEAHQGKLVCKSNEAEGTTFFVLLKL